MITYLWCRISVEPVESLVVAVAVTVASATANPASPRVWYLWSSVLVVVLLQYPAVDVAIDEARRRPGIGDLTARRSYTR